MVIQIIEIHLGSRSRDLLQKDCNQWIVFCEALMEGLWSDIEWG